MTPLDRWLDALLPGAAARYGRMLTALPHRPTFEDLRLWSSSGLPAELVHTLESTEWSEREGAPGLRFASTVDPERLPKGWLTAAMRRISPTLAPEPIAAFETRRPGGLLIGVDEAEDRVRAKLYVYPDRRDAPFDPTPALQTVGVDAAAVADQLDALGLQLAFVALDLLPDGAGGAKLYLDPGGKDAAADVLRRLGDDALAEQAEALPAAVDDDPFGTVLTLRWRGDRHVDTTLHARALRLDVADWLGPTLGARWAELNELGPALHPTHVSWIGDVRTVYYMLGPR